MADTEAPRLEPVPETAGLPEHSMPSADETADGLLPDAASGPEARRVAADLGLDLPDDPEEAMNVLAAALLDARRDAGEYMELMQRIAADFDNYRKRVERDQTDMVLRASQRVVERLLPALDSFDAAMAYEPQTPSEEKFLDGMRGTHAQLMDILESEGLSAVPAVGEEFDPALHEAAAQPANDGDGPLVVTEELRRGYVMRGRVIRPSLVVVEHR